MTSCSSRGSAPSSRRCARRGRTSASTRSARRRARWSRWRAAARCSSSPRTTTSGSPTAPEVVEAGIEGLRRYGAGHRVRALHLRHVRAAPRARARARRPRRHGGGAHLRLLLERERGLHPLADRRPDGDPLRRAEPRVDHRRDPAREAGAEGGLQALRHGRPARPARVARAGAARARHHRRRLLDGGRPREAPGHRRARRARTTRRSSSTTRTARA